MLKYAVQLNTQKQKNTGTWHDQHIRTYVLTSYSTVNKCNYCCCVTLTNLFMVY